MGGRRGEEQDAGNAGACNTPQTRGRACISAPLGLRADTPPPSRPRPPPPPLRLVASLRRPGGGPAAYRELTSGEREDLLRALKTKWDAVNRQYQQITYRKISTSNSTIGEIRWKELCEKQLEQLEADIKALSVKGQIYVAS